MPLEFEGLFRRRRLPHWDVDGRPYFITACLEGSIPAVGLQSIRRYRQELNRCPRPEGLNPAEWNERLDKLMFAFVDRILDHDPPVSHLADDRLAQVVEEAVLHFADERYLLIAWCVMPSHLHWLFTPLDAWSHSLTEAQQAVGKRKRTPREAIMQSILSYTGKACNRLILKEGPFWQVESWDHWVRNDEELLRIVEYIEQNPVKAGFVSKPSDWRWSSARIRANLGIRPGEAISKKK